MNPKKHHTPLKRTALCVAIPFVFTKRQDHRRTSSVCCKSYESNKSWLGTVVLGSLTRLSIVVFTASHLSTTCSPPSPSPELGSSGKLPSSQPKQTRMQSGKKTGGGERPPRPKRATKTRSARVPRCFGCRAGLDQLQSHVRSIVSCYVVIVKGGGGAVTFTPDEVKNDYPFCDTFFRTVDDHGPAARNQRAQTAIRCLMPTSNQSTPAKGK